MAYLEACLRSGGYRVGAYTSPHLLRYNERVRIARREADDVELVDAFSAVETARGNMQLTYFEFGTLAAAWLFVDARIDVAILEVGLGGRLDAVNVFDADCALVTSVALDHMDYLGTTREEIGYEKAGIFRAGRAAICADPEPPQSLRRHAAEIGAPLLVRGVDFDFEAERTQWRYRGPHGSRHGLPYPVLRGTHQLANASACLTALDVPQPSVQRGGRCSGSLSVHRRRPRPHNTTPVHPSTSLYGFSLPAWDEKLKVAGVEGHRRLSATSMWTDSAESFPTPPPTSMKNLAADNASMRADRRLGSKLTSVRSHPGFTNLAQESRVWNRD
jgi:hypothetical protein